MKKTAIFLAMLYYSLSFAQKTQDTTKVQTVKSITIEGKKKLLERKADRLVFNVDASLASQGMDAVETLGNVPMMRVDENKGIISIVGKSSVSVMINGRMLNLSGDALMSYLKTIRSENILKIEVITTPPAKYEAQGNSGLINIVLKKNPNMG
ncbi:TonB-dependent receptor, partial [Elizabethkingia meningoseptica]|nr:TonB-dependent receptor [Elizabethkingia meningoseptica]